MAQRRKTARTLGDGKRGSANEAVIRLHRSSKNGRKMRPKCTMFRARLCPPCASTRVRNRTRNNRIKFYFAKIFRSKTCVCAIFVVPLHPI